MSASNWASVIVAVLGLIAIAIVTVFAFTSKNTNKDWTLRVCIVSTVALVLSVAIPALVDGFA